MFYLVLLKRTQTQYCTRQYWPNLLVFEFPILIWTFAYLVTQKSIRIFPYRIYFVYVWAQMIYLFALYSYSHIIHYCLDGWDGHRQWPVSAYVHCMIFCINFRHCMYASVVNIPCRFLNGKDELYYFRGIVGSLYILLVLSQKVQIMMLPFESI